MNYLSICSGIEAATVAWHPLGWRPLGFSEIEPFPSAVLAHHWPDVPNLGDMTQHANWPSLRPQLIVGGTPCQAFSVAGLRKGLADPRGNLTLTFLGILARYRPKWVVWENVPGVLSDRTGAFGSFLSGLAELGYGWAYRVLDAQHFGVPQRRRRVFAVGHFGDWRRAAAVLFERESLLRNPPPSREEGKGTSRGFECGPQGGGFTNLAPTLDTRYKDGQIRNQLGCGVLAYGGNNTSGSIDAAPALNANRGCHNPGDFEAGTLLVDHVTHSLRGEGHDASEDGTGRGTPIVPIAFPEYLSGTQCAASENLSPTLQSVNPTVVAFNLRGREGGAMPEADPDNLASQRAASGGSSRSYVAHKYAVRRLTPTECERLQGFPDGHTLIPWRSRPAADCPDGPRYKALGNSMAVPVMNWIGRRIELISNLSHD